MRKVHFITSIAVVLCLLLLCSPVASAASFSDGVNDLTITNADVDSGGTLTAAIEGSTTFIFGSSNSKTVTITNNSPHDVTLNGDLNFTSNGGEAKFTITGGSATTVPANQQVTIKDPNYTLTANGGKLQITMQSPKGQNNFLKLSWALKVQAKIEYTVTFAPGDHGSYTVGGTEITANTPAFKIDGALGTAISVTPDARYVCLGFVDASGKMVIGMPAAATAGGVQTMTYYPTGNGLTLTPVFATGFSEQETTKLPFSSNGKYYYTWESAMAAGYGSTVVLNQDYTLPTTLADNGLSAAGTYVTGTDGNLTYTVPGATTLLIPFDADATQGDAVKESGAYKMSKFRELTMPAGTHMTINGTVLVHSTQGQYNTWSMGNPVGPYGCLTMKSGSTITVNGILKVRGMLIGDDGMQIVDPDASTAPITVNSGGKVVQLVQICDFRGGKKALAWQGSGAFLVNQLYVTNVQVGTRYMDGSALEGQYYFYINSTSFPGPLNMIGPGTNCMFTLSSGHIDMGYDRENAATVIDIAGKVDMNYVELKFTYMAAITLKSSDNQLPLFAGWTVNLKDGANVSINHDAKILPGCEVTVEQGATLNVNSNVYLYDVADYVQRGECYSYSGYRKYPNTYYTGDYPTGCVSLAPEEVTDGRLIVNGTLNINANVTRADGTTTNGALYTSTNAGKDGTFPLCSTENTGVINVNKAASASVNLTELIQATSETETKVAFTAGKSFMAPNCTVDPLAGTTGTYYHMVDHGWHTAQHTVTEKVTVEPNCTETGIKQISCTCGYFKEEVLSALGHNYVSKVTEPTCTVDGYTTHTCSRCNDTYTDSPVKAPGHTDAIDKAVDPDCENTGLTEGKRCSVCKEVLVAQTVIPALGHDEVIDPFVDATCTEPGMTEGKHCSRCDKVLVAQTEIPNLGHSYNSVKTAATCLEDGYTTYTCHCGDSYVGDTVTARGYHLWTNGACTDCQTPFAFQGINIDLNESIDLYFYVNKADVAQPDAGFYAELAKEGAADSITIQMTDWEDYDATRYRFCYPDIPAKEMTDAVTVELFYSDKTRVTDPAKPMTESVRSYAHNIYDQRGGDELGTALADMLNYGAASQILFGYKNDDLANQDTGDGLMALATPVKDDDDTVLLKSSERTKGDYYRGSTFSALNQLMYTFYFDFGLTADGKINVDDNAYAVVTYYDPAKPDEVVEITVPRAQWYIRSGKLCGVDVTAIPIGWGRTVMSCTVYDGNGKVLSEGNTDSIMALAKRANADGDTNLYEAMRSLMRFVDSSNTYFKNEDGAA